MMDRWKPQYAYDYCPRCDDDIARDTKLSIARELYDIAIAEAKEADWFYDRDKVLARIFDYTSRTFEDAANRLALEALGWEGI